MAGYSEAVDLVFGITSEQVRLTGPDLDVSAGHGGIPAGLARAGSGGQGRPGAPGQAWPGHIGGIAG
jgi:hypothetical protein